MDRQQSRRLRDWHTHTRALRALFFTLATLFELCSAVVGSSAGVGVGRGLPGCWRSLFEGGAGRVAGQSAFKGPRKARQSEHKNNSVLQFTVAIVASLGGTA